MISFILKRCVQIIPVLLGVVLIVFLLNSFMPGDPVQIRLGDTYTQEQYDNLKEEMGLNDPLLVRFAKYLWGIVTRFDLGDSYSTGQPVLDSVKNRAPISIKIGLLSVLMGVIIGIPVGIISAIRQNTALDYTITSLSIFFASVPNFWLALMSIILFALTWKVLPASGLTDWKSYILPVVCNGMMTVAAISRMTRSSMLEVVRLDYIKTARAKGLQEHIVILKHVLLNALIPVITMTGGQIAIVIGGSVVIETIFNIPGMGTLMVKAISTRDYPVVTGVTFVISLFVSILNLLVDLLYCVVDPRIKGNFSGSRRKRIHKLEEETA